MSTTNRELYRDFYALCCTTADRVQIAGQQVPDALAATLRSWSALVRRKVLLSDDAQIGAIGELLFLRRAARIVGWVDAVDAWQGPSREEHDFTFARADVEVKTTRSERRLHHIGSLTQLLAKPDRPLSVVSIQVTPSSGDDAISLARLVSRTIADSSRESRSASDGIRERLARIGWSDDDAGEYAIGYRLRSPMAVISVDAAFPAIVPASIAVLGEGLLARIERVSYWVDVDGMGILDGTKRFDRALFK